MSLSVDIRHRLQDLVLDVQFEAPDGVTALIGRSGAGKTSVAHVMAGLLRPDHARVSVGPEPLADTKAGLWHPPKARRVGYVFQDARLFPHLSVEGNLLYGARRRGRLETARREMDQVLDLLGIAPLLSRRPVALSGGERQRVAIGRALLSGPRLLLLDEPLAALDPARKAEILPYLERLRDQADMPILYITHAMEEVARLATHVVVLEDGKVAASGPVASVLSDPAAVPALAMDGAGAVLETILEAQEDDGLSRLRARAGPLFLPRVEAPPGARVRVRIAAQEVMISLTRPEGVSALNLLPAKVIGIRQGRGPGALVQLDAGGDMLLARITRRSAKALGLAPGLAVHAVIKSLAVASANVGTGADLSA